MAEFYGTLQGTRGRATRLGGRKSGMEVYAASWKGAVRSKAFYNPEKKEDWVRVELTPWQGAGVNKLLYLGPIGGRKARVSKIKVKRGR